MSNRPTHNRIAKKVVPQADMKTIDAVNKDVDNVEYIRKYGKFHRKYHGHDPNPYSKDSLAVNKGSATLEKIRQTHILVDTNPKIKNEVKRMELREQIKRMRGK